MYTIIMNQDKTLQATNKVTLYQRDNLVDTMCFLIPSKYENHDLSDFTVILQYTDLANIPHAEILQCNEEMYKNKLKYTLPIDSDITKYAGDVVLSLTFSKTDIENKKQYVLHTGEISIAIDDNNCRSYELY